MKPHTGSEKKREKERLGVRNKICLIKLFAKKKEGKTTSPPPFINIT